VITEVATVVKVIPKPDILFNEVPVIPLIRILFVPAPDPKLTIELALSKPKLEVAPKLESTAIVKAMVPVPVAPPKLSVSKPPPAPKK
jgi:hypothetical protein